MNSEFRIQNLHASIGDKEILHGISLTIKPGKLHVVMGPNGSGKSTLAQTLMGHPSYKIKNQEAKCKIGRKSILELHPEDRAKAGLILAFQNPVAVPGVTVSSFLRTAYVELYGKDRFSILEFHKLLHEQAEKLELDPAFLRRAINDGFSGGEKKKAEMLQLLMLKPKFAIFDEIDTGLDVDALRTVASGIVFLQKEGSGVLLITHYQRILDHLEPDRVHVMVAGQIVAEGGSELVKIIEEKGYGNIHRTSAIPLRI